jgi:hypothetical protein
MFLGVLFILWRINTRIARMKARSPVGRVLDSKTKKMDWSGKMAVDEDGRDGYILATD